jgi:hypothetical protein
MATIYLNVSVFIYTGIYIFIYIYVCEQFLQVYLKISGNFNNLNYFYIFKGFVMAVIVWL